MPYSPVNTGVSPNTARASYNAQTLELFDAVDALEAGESYTTFHKLASDTTLNSTSFADTGLQHSVVADQVYSFRAVVIFHTAGGADTDAAWGISGPASPTVFAYQLMAETTNAGRYYEATNTYDGGALIDSAVRGVLPRLAYIDGIIIPSANGTLKVRGRSESTAQIIVVAGSSLEVF